MSKKFISVPIQYNKSTVFESDEIKIPVEILVMHDKKNLNQSNFEMDAIESAKESIKNIPILGYIRKVDGSDSMDFAGHEMELTLNDGELKVIYLERPIGVVPESNNYEYVEINGKIYVKVIGYIWKEYLNDGYEILQENPNKSVSMEITVDDYAVNNDGTINIKAYRYLGVTVLGDNVSPAMEGANMQVIDKFNGKFSNDFYEKVELLNKELQEKFSKVDDQTVDIHNKKGGNEIMSKKEEVKLEESIQTDAEKNENKDLSFSATYKQKRCAIDNALDPIVIKDKDGNYVSETYYWLDDFDDTYCMVEKSVWDANGYDCQYGRFTYSFDETVITATITSEFEKLIKTALTQEEYDNIMSERETLSADFEALKIETENYKNSIDSLEIEKEELNKKVSEFELSIKEKDEKISTLQEYQNTKELEIKQSQIENIISDFEVVLADNEEFKAIKEKSMDYEIDTLEEKLFALEGKVKHSKNTKTAKKPQVFSSKVSVDIEAENHNDSYYGEAVKYITK